MAKDLKLRFNNAIKKAIAGDSKFILFDRDYFNVNSITGNTDKWTPRYLVGSEGGSCDINISNIGKMRIAVEPDASPTFASYANVNQNKISSRDCKVMVNFINTFGVPNTGEATGSLGIGIDADYLSNYVSINRVSSIDAPFNYISTVAKFGGISQGITGFVTSVEEVAFKIERSGNIFKVYYSLTQIPNENWVLFVTYTDSANALNVDLNVVVEATSPATAQTQTAIIDISNFKIETLSTEINYIIEPADGFLMNSNKDGDLFFSDNDLETDEGLTTAVLISVYTDKRASIDDGLDDLNDLRGWWGDDVSEIEGDEIGSKLWLLDRASTTRETLSRAKTYLEDCVEWMVEDGVVAKVEATTLRLNDVLAAVLKLYKNDGKTITIKFSNLWEAQYAI